MKVRGTITIENVFEIRVVKIKWWSGKVILDVRIADSWKRRELSALDVWNLTLYLKAA